VAGIGVRVGLSIVFSGYGLVDPHSPLNLWGLIFIGAYVMPVQTIGIPSEHGNDAGEHFWGLFMQDLCVDKWADFLG